MRFNIYGGILETQHRLFEEFSDVVTIDDLRNMLKIGKTLAYSLVKENKIESVKVGRNYRIQKIKVIEYLEKEKVNDG